MTRSYVGHKSFIGVYKAFYLLWPTQYEVSIQVYDCHTFVHMNGRMLHILHRPMHARPLPPPPSLPRHRTKDEENKVVMGDLQKAQHLEFIKFTWKGTSTSRDTSRKQSTRRKMLRHRQVYRQQKGRKQKRKRQRGCMYTRESIALVLL